MPLGYNYIIIEGKTVDKSLSLIKLTISEGSRENPYIIEMTSENQYHSYSI